MAVGEFIKITSVGQAASLLSQDLNELSRRQKKILWLVPGGSAAAVAAEVSQKLSLQKNICISLTDERYGPLGHPQSNWRRLQELGFDFGDMTTVPILSGKDKDASTSDFDRFLSRSRHEFDFIVGLFGMGEDGHTAGFLPGSPALRSPHFAESYQGPDYFRITLTPAFLSHVGTACLYAEGTSKHKQLARLGDVISLEEQPAQALKKCRVLKVYNDWRGENI